MPWRWAILATRTFAAPYADFHGCCCIVTSYRIRIVFSLQVIARFVLIVELMWRLLSGSLDTHTKWMGTIREIKLINFPLMELLWWYETLRKFVLHFLRVVRCKTSCSIQCRVHDWKLAWYVLGFSNRKWLSGSGCRVYSTCCEICSVIIS